MRFEFKPSFDRSIKSLSPSEKEEVKSVAADLIDSLAADRQIYKGLGLKRLVGDYWEVRHGIRVRILFRWRHDLAEFVLAGNHDDVKRFLKNI